MKKIIHIEDLKDEWREMLSIYREDYKKAKDHTFFCYEPHFGYFNIFYGEEPLKDSDFPKYDDYPFDDTYNLYSSQAKILETFRMAYEEQVENSELYKGDKLITIYPGGDLGFNTPIVHTVAEWTAEYFKEIESRMKKIYFRDGSGAVTLTYVIND